MAEPTPPATDPSMDDILASIRRILNEDEAPKNDTTRLPENGCNLELTRVLAGPTQQVWWTFGCEAFGQSLGAVEQNLRMFLDSILAKEIPEAERGMEASYPAWMSNLSL